MSGKLEIISRCSAAPKRLPITMCHSALTVELLICQSGYQKQEEAEEEEEEKEEEGRGEAHSRT